MKSREASHSRRTRFIRLDTHRCEACWDCLEVCPKRVFGKIDLFVHRHVIIRDAGACNGCKKCVRACESSAITYIYEPASDRAERQVHR
jgi:NAD-dependent dihydropyrimidine dehydrogenase PreA subunit